MDKEVKWAIVGPGSIAREFYDDLEHIPGTRHVVQSLVGRRAESLEAFRRERAVERTFLSVKELIEAGGADCAYIATPHPLHYEACLELLEAGVPVLCEKPLAINERQVTDLINKSKETGTFLMEGMWIRCLPSIEKTLEIISSGRIGEVSSIEARLTYKAPYDEKSRYFDPQLGGGSLLDLGVYPVYLAQIILGKPDSVKAAGKKAPTGVDGGIAAILAQDRDTYALIESSLIKRAPNEAVIYGDKGSITISEPWNEKPGLITIQIYNEDKEEITPQWPGKGLYFQVIEMMNCIRENRTESRLLSHQQSIDVVKIMDQIRAQIDVKYPNE